MLAFGVQKYSFKPKFSQKGYIFSQFYYMYVKFDKKVNGVIGCGLSNDKHLISRDGFKTQPAVDRPNRRFFPIAIVLNNDNGPEPPVPGGQPPVEF